MSKIIKRIVMFMVAFTLCFSVPAEVPFSTTITSEAAPKCNLNMKTLILKEGETFQIKVRGVKGEVKYGVNENYHQAFKFCRGEDEWDKYTRGSIYISKKGLIKAKKGGSHFTVMVKIAERNMFYFKVWVQCKKHKWKAEYEYRGHRFYCSVCGYIPPQEFANAQSEKKMPVLSPYDVQAKIDSLRSKCEGSYSFDNLNEDVFGTDGTVYCEKHEDFSRLKPGDSIVFSLKIKDWPNKVSHSMVVYDIKSCYIRFSDGKLKVGYEIIALDASYGWFDEDDYWNSKTYYLLDNKLYTYNQSAKILSPKIYSYYKPSEEYIIKEPGPEPELTSAQKRKLERTGRLGSGKYTVLWN